MTLASQADVDRPEPAPSDPIVLVTGAGSGLGAGIARSLAEGGSHVVLAGRTAATLHAVADGIVDSGGSASVQVADLSEAGAATALVDRTVANEGRLDSLVHAAGNQHRSSFLDYPEEAFRELLELHLVAAFRLGQAVARHLVERSSGGSVVFVGSMTSQAAGVRGVTGYAAAKSGLLGLMRTMAVELGVHGIRVNTIAPGFFATEMTRDVDGDPYRASLHARIPAGHLGEPRDVGALASFLTSDRSSYITGQCIAVDGGWSVA